MSLKILEIYSTTENVDISDERVPVYSFGWVVNGNHSQVTKPTKISLGDPYDIFFSIEYGEVTDNTLRITLYERTLSSTEVNIIVIGVKRSLVRYMTVSEIHNYLDRTLDISCGLSYALLISLI